MISAASRESEQPTITAKGCCPSATAAAVPGVLVGVAGAPVTNRRLPACSSASACSGLVGTANAVPTSAGAPPVAAPGASAPGPVECLAIRDDSSHTSLLT